MKIINHITIAICLMIGLLVNCVYAQTRFDDYDYKSVKKVAQSGYQFLKIGIGTRNTGMGDAGVTGEGEAAAIFWNPAGITSVEGTAVFVGYTNWIADMQQQAMSLVINLHKWGVFGLSAINMDNGDIMGTAIKDNRIGYEDTGLLDIAEYAIGLGYARRFTDKFGLGVTVKYCKQDLVAASSDVVAFDIGTIYNTGYHDVKIGMSVQHFSQEIKYVGENFELPLTFRIGISADVLSLAGSNTKTHKFVVALEGVNPRDYSERVHLGMEYWFREMAALRCGYKFNYDYESYSFGVGFRLFGSNIGYSYSEFDDFLGSVNRFSVEMHF